MAGSYFDAMRGATVPENYQRYFVPAIGEPLAEDLLRTAALRPGERVLDVGCGTGVVTRLAAERVGPGGMVAGLDVNPAMLAVAKSVTPADARIEWHQASAEAIPLADESFDVVLCQLSLQFVGDRSRAVAEMHRVLVPGGRLVVSVPGPAHPMFQTLAGAMGRHVSPQAAGFVRAVFAMDDEAQLQTLVGNAGFRDVDIRAEERDLSLPGARDFLWQYVGSTPLAGAVAEASGEARSALEHDVLADWSRFEDGGRMSYRQRVLTAVGRRPERSSASEASART